MSAATEAVEPVLDAASDAILEGIDDTVEVLEVVRNNPALLAAAGLVGLAAGGALGFFVAKKKLESFYEDLASQEIAEARSYYQDRYKVDEDGNPISPQEVMRALHGDEAAEAVAARASLRTYQGLDDQEEAQLARSESRVQERTVSTPVGEATVVRTETTNVFVDKDFDYDEELKNRREDRPYVISHDEYFENEPDNDQSALTYYQVDDTLVDEMDKPVEGINKIVGDESLVRFGHGAKDPNVVYVRNELMGMDFEITRSTGSYLEEVLGMTEDGDSATLKHSSDRARRRAFRNHED